MPTKAENAVTTINTFIKITIYFFLLIISIMRKHMMVDLTRVGIMTITNILPFIAERIAAAKRARFKKFKGLLIIKYSLFVKTVISQKTKKIPNKISLESILPGNRPTV